ncbi:MAG: sensor histidine kinase [Vicinamibacteria bacterium]
MRSLRARLLWGALLWTIGLLAATNVAVTLLLGHRLSGPLVHLGAMSVVAVGLLAAGLSQVRTGMSLLGRLRTRLAAVRDGRASRVEGEYPAEVRPLVDDLNSLLEERERSVERAQAKAGDLAHGLKTPLAVLAQEAIRAAAAGHGELAASIGQQVERMRRQVDYHLAHARAAASGAHLGARAGVDESAQSLARTLLRLHAERGLEIELNVPGGHAVRCQRQDLDEMLGNLLDNACKWARARVALRASLEAGFVVILVDDDGPGIEPSSREAVLRRGVRADEQAPGSGIGLSIVRDLAEVYGGSIELAHSPAGGLRAVLRLPAA